MSESSAFKAPHWCELRHLQVMEVGGPDAQLWLQGQTTQDVSPLGVGQSTYSLFVTNQGKILADAWIHRGNENFRLVVPQSCASALLERLQRYIVMEDVNVRILSESVIHVVGPNGAKVAIKVPNASPCARLGESGFDIFVTHNQRAQAEKVIAQECASLGGAILESDAWAAARIANAIPEIGVDFGPENFPQEAGLAQRAVSFTKGCYLGQEPVAMLQHRGKTKKQLCLLRCEGAPALASQSEIVTIDGARAGVITSAHAFAERAYTLALGYVQCSALDSKVALRVSDAAVVVLQVLGRTETH